MFCCTGCRKSKSKNLKQLSEQEKKEISLKEPADNSKDQEELQSQQTLSELSERTDTKKEENPEIIKVSLSNNTEQPAELHTETRAQVDAGDKGTLEVSQRNREESEVVIKKETTWSQSQVPVEQKEQSKAEITGQLSTTDADLSEDISSVQLLKSVEPVNSEMEFKSSSDGVLAPFVVAYDDLMNGGHLSSFLSVSNTIGGSVKAQADLVLEAFHAQRSFLVVVSRSKQPPPNQLMSLLQPTSSKIEAIQKICESNRGDAFFNHLSAISDSISALGWVGTNIPCPYIKEMSDSALFYTNRVLKEFKGKDEKHVAWTQAWTGTLNSLRDYVKQYHTTGPSWNPRGGDAKMPPSDPAGFTAPPPPPPPPPPMTDEDISENDQSEARDALFKDLSKGTEITKTQTLRYPDINSNAAQGLKKVTDDMKTHKNPALRKGPAPYKTTSGPQPFRPTAGTVIKPAPKTPILELQDKKWIVEHHQGNHSISITDTTIKQTVYVYNCQQCTIQISGKINSIVIDGCKRTGVVFDDVISAVEFINCQSVKTQVTGKVPTVSIEKTDGCMVYLSKTSLETEIVTAKCSEVNVLIPQENGDYVEYYIPEQLKSTWNGKSIVTVCSDNK